MAKGLPKSIAKKYGITKKAWQVYRGRKKSSSRKRSSKRKTKRKRSNMPRRKRRGGNRKITLPISLIAPVVITVTKRMPSGSSIVENIQKGDWGTLSYNLTELIGIEAPSGKFRLDYLINTIMPFVGGYVLHKVAGMLGINRWLGRAKIPFIRI